MFKGIIGALRVDLGMNSAQFHKGASEATLSMRKMQADFSGLAKEFGKIGGRMSLALTTPLVALAKQAMDLQTVQATAVAQVDAALASMGQTAGFTSEQLQSMASGLQGSSLFGDEDILGKVTSTLLTFGNVSGEAFIGAQQAALDMSAALGQDLQGAAIMLGKALNDPLQGLSSLSEVGVSFTEGQKNTIKTMVELGDVAGAQEKILDALRQQYAGQAQALRDLPSGQIKAAMMDIGDAMEQVGAIILPVVADLAGRVSDLALAFQSLSPETKRFVVIGGAVAAALGPALLALGGMAAAASALLPVVVAIASPIGLLVGGFAALAAGAVYVGVKLKGAIDRVGGFGTALGLAMLGDQLREVQDTVAQAFKLAGSGVTTSMVAGVNVALDKIDTKGLSEAEVQAKVEAWFAGYADTVTQAFAGVAFDQLQSLAAVKTMLEPLGQGFWGSLQNMAISADALVGMAGGLETLSGQISSFTEGFYSDAERFRMVSASVHRQFADLGLAVPQTAAQFRELVNSQNLMTTAGQQTYASLMALSGQFLEFNTGTQTLWTGLSDVTAMLTPLGQGFAGTAEAMIWASDDLIAATGGLSSLSSQIASFTNTFYSEGEQLGMASDELGRRFAELGLAVPQTARQFRDLVTGQDLMTEAGRGTYAALLSLSELFAKVEGGASSLAGMDLSAAYDLGSYYASEFDARIASIAEARGYAADVHAAGDAGVTLAASLGRLSEGDTAQTNALRRLVDLIQGWDAIGMPIEREF
jgi:hypothetical protein